MAPPSPYPILFEHLTLPVWEAYINGIMKYTCFWVCLLLLNITFVRFIWLVAHCTLQILILFFLICDIVAQCSIVWIHHNVFIHPVDTVHLDLLHCDVPVQVLAWFSFLISLFPPLGGSFLFAYHQIRAVPGQITHGSLTPHISVR